MLNICVDGESHFLRSESYWKKLCGEKTELEKLGCPAVFVRLLRYYRSKGRAAQKFFWSCLWKTFRRAPRIVGQMVIYMGMYVHLCELHRRTAPWNAWTARDLVEESPATGHS